MAISRKGALNKGKQGEREFTLILNSSLGKINKRRKEMGRSPVRLNVISSVHSNCADIQSIPGLCIEVKRQEVLNLNSWWAQAERQADNQGGIPCVAYRQNRGKWNVLLPAMLMGIGIRGYVICSLETFEDWLYIFLD